MASRIKKWRGKEVTQEVAKNVAKAFSRFALVAEGHSKKELRRGHGVRYGTLRRSIHVAQPGYDWSGDDMEPGAGTPELGGRSFDAIVDGKKITIQLGSGLHYALPVHQGHDGFEGYHYITIGVDKAKKDLPKILKEFAL